MVNYDTPPVHPLRLFEELFAAAQKTQTIDPTAAALATANKKGEVSVRMVLVKSWNENGFVFYTNLHSKKALHLKDNPTAALCFYWDCISHQIRIEGNARQVSNQIADDYFKTRPPLSQLGAWASLQSQKMSNEDELKKSLEHHRQKFGTDSIKRPPYWGGYALKPQSIEFWQRGEGRLHHRLLYERKRKAWHVSRLYP